MKKNKILLIIIIISISFVSVFFLNEKVKKNVKIDSNENKKIIIKKDKKNTKEILSGVFNNNKIIVFEKKEYKKNGSIKPSLYIKTGGGVKKIDEYDIEGWVGKDTVVIDAFFYKKSDKSDYLVVITEKDMNKPMIEMIGKTYSIHFYDNNLIEDKNILSFFKDFNGDSGGIGFDGKLEDEKVEFKYKTREQIVDKLEELEKEGKL